MAQDTTWTNASVALMAGDHDPVEAISRRARKLVLDAIDAGWSGPPFDPFSLADLRKVEVVATAEVSDARIVPVGEKGRFRIEYNPSRPRGRVRYSVAHELAHTLFPDAGQSIRHRMSRREMQADDWQLETLCNVAAAEFLMPLGSFPKLRGEDASIHHIADLRQIFDVSMEALLIRLARLSEDPIAVFAASFIESGTTRGRYRVEYVIPAGGWTESLPTGLVLPLDSIPSQCSAIGFTAVGDESWPGWRNPHRVECLGLPPYPGARKPRVAGILRSSSVSANVLRLEFVRGDATSPRDRPCIVAHIVNNGTPNWGGAGFARAVRRTWPQVQNAFRQWATAGLRLGEMHETEAEPHVWVASMIAQSGYGPSAKPRIRYSALREALSKVREVALAKNASVHMPRIGTGEARGDWMIVEELVRNECVRFGVPVTVYDLPGARPSQPEQPSLSLQT